MEYVGNYEKNIKMNCEETECKGLDWIHLGLDVNQSKALQVFVNHQPLKRILLHAVS